MFKENFPIIDPLASGHSAADKVLEKQKIKALENEADLVTSIEKSIKEEEKKNLEEIYEKDPEEEWFKK